MMNSTASSSSNRSLYFVTSSDNLIINSTIRSTNISAWCYSVNITFVNTTFNRSGIEWWAAGIADPCPTPLFTNITVKWYVNFSVLDTLTGAPIASAAVNATPAGYATDGQSLFNGTTDSNGQIWGLTEFIEFIANGTFTYNESSQQNFTTYNNLTNYTFYANKTNYYTNYTNSTINESKTIGLILRYGDIGFFGTLTQNTTMTQNLQSSGTCIIIGAHNIHLNCSGYQILQSGATSGEYFGVLNPGYDNITVRDCTIINFTHGISYTAGADNGTIVNNTLINNTQANLYLNYSNN